ncbi:MAG TPA: hypothetical protein PLN54_13100 [Flavobacteriales bacterium]|nr:hypothetical protein [Flavobacteriales bacterium]
MRISAFLVILLAVLTSTQVHGQSARDDAFFRGAVVDAVTGEPIPFVRIKVHRPDRSWDGQCDYDGWFFIRCPKQWMFVEVSWKGYETQYFVVDLNGGYADVPIALKRTAGN